MGGFCQLAVWREKLVQVVIPCHGGSRDAPLRKARGTEDLVPTLGVWRAVLWSSSTTLRQKTNQVSLAFGQGQGLPEWRVPWQPRFGLRRAARRNWRLKMQVRVALRGLRRYRQGLGSTS